MSSYPDLQAKVLQRKYSPVINELLDHAVGKHPEVRHKRYEDESEIFICTSCVANDVSEEKLAEKPHRSP